ncbi:MAG: nucleotidyltransferase family protein [Lachnospira sp.]
MLCNLNKINKVKLDKIIKGLNYLEEENNKEHVIDKVIIFGSAVTDDCRGKSDIDICLVTDYDSSNNTFFKIYGGLPLVMDELCDIAIYNRVSGCLKNEIDNNGVCRVIKV